MASKTTLNAQNLETLGAAHLARLLIEISEGNANAKRRLRLELAGSESPSKLGNEIRKRLTAIGAATTNIGWRTLKGFRADLNTQRRLIAEQITTAAPQDAYDLIWQFIALGDAVIERSSDASGGVHEVMAAGCQDAAAIVALAKPEVDDLVMRITAAQMTNSYGQNDNMVPLMATFLGEDGLLRLRDAVLVAAKAPAAAITSRSRPVKRWRKRVLAASEALRKRSHADSIRVALLAIADALSDVEAFISLMADAYLPATAAQIAHRLLKADRPADALKALDGARQNPRFDMPAEWINARIAALDALDRKAEAQIMRLERFRRTLQADYLRAWLKRLPDFDDIEAEDAELDRVKAWPDANTALGLLIGWPSLERAAHLVIDRVREMDGNDAERLTYAADRLSSRYPLAALLVQRQIVEARLASFSEAAHEAAVLSYLEAESLSRHIDDFGRHDPHDAWQKKLANTYARRTVFWKGLP